MNNRSKQVSHATFIVKNMQKAASDILSIVKQSLLPSLEYSFQSIKRLRSNKKVVKKQTKQVNLQSQFINHCATLIQAHFRKYIQQKRYKMFLPIYRRLRQILYAGFEGWKTRKIMKLGPIKTQIRNIKDKDKNKQTNMARIHKRQLIDQIQRLRRRGRWVEVQRKEKKQPNSQRKSLSSKENVSLYGNVKSKSIKNIFTGGLNQVDQQQKPKIQKKNVKALVINDEKQLLSSTKYSSGVVTTNKKHLKTFDDEIPLARPRDFYELLQEKCELKVPQTETKNRLPKKKVVPRPNMKRKQVQSKVSTQMCSLEGTLQQSKMSSVDKASIIDLMGQETEREQCDNVEKKAKGDKPQKLKITLGRRTEENSSKMSESRQSSIPSQRQPLKQALSDTCFLQELQKLKRPRNQQKLSCVSGLLKLYDESYITKKQNIEKKLSGIYP